jgi:alkaline phosphatase D
VLPRQRTTCEHPSSALRSDAWDGYPATFHSLLAFICSERIEHCVFLSGDEHLSCVAHASLRGPDAERPPLKLLSIHSSAFYAPYPFANAMREDLAHDETFEFEAPPHAGKFSCTVKTHFPGTGDGFATIALAQKTQLTVTFHGRGEPWKRTINL